MRLKIVQILMVHLIFLNSREASSMLLSTTFHAGYPRRPLPLRLESRRASILSLSNFDSNLGLQQLQVDLDLDLTFDYLMVDDLDNID